MTVTLVGDVEPHVPCVRCCHAADRHMKEGGGDGPERYGACRVCDCPQYQSTVEDNGGRE
jgi:hypothetical protein